VEQGGTRRHKNEKLGGNNRLPFIVTQNKENFIYN